MDCISNQLEFIFENLQLDESFEPFLEDWQLELGVVADFQILADGEVLYSEKEFCLVEFAKQVWDWTADVADCKRDFCYHSLESDEPTLVWIKRRNGLWAVGSSNQEYEKENGFELTVIVTQVRCFVEDLINDVPFPLKKSVSSLIFG